MQPRPVAVDHLSQFKLITDVKKPPNSGGFFMDVFSTFKLNCRHIT